jgi:hypothetical protein
MITARVFPVFAFKNTNLTEEVHISLGERATIGPYSTSLLDINNNTAKISMCTTEYAWEQILQTKIQPQIGNITVQDMIRWSRFHAIDLEGLRPMCENQNTYEAAMIFKIPTDHADLLSSGWFAANHACSSIYIPVHICDDDFYDPYETGDAATLSLELLQKYGHGTVTSLCQSVENVFLVENEVNEALAHLMIHAQLNVTPFLTELDSEMQEQAFLTEQLWLNTPNASRGIIENIWMDKYTLTLYNIQEAIAILNNLPRSEISIFLLQKIAQSICECKKQQRFTQMDVTIFDII